MKNKLLLTAVADERVALLHAAHRDVTAVGIASTIRKWVRDMGDVEINKISGAMLECWIEKMNAQGLAPNTINYYYRGLSSVYNRAKRDGKFTDTLRPFDAVYPKAERTRKRALSVNDLRKLEAAELDGREAEARDVFMLSFYLRGIAPVDIWKLTKSNYQKGIITYRRSKTRQKLEMRVEPEARKIIDRYASTSPEKLLSLPSYYVVTWWLKKIGEKLKLAFPLTLYCARHTWATTAQRYNIPLSVISQGLGHDNEETTRIYLADIEQGVIDKANRKIINSIFK